MTTPTPGQPLSEADVSLLQPGDWLLHPQWGAARYAPESEDDRFLTGPWAFLGRPDQDGWIAWSGGENPVPGAMVYFRLRDGQEGVGRPAENYVWQHEGGLGDIIAYRPHAPVSRPGDGVEDVHVRADDAARVHAPEMERSAENQRPKTRDWRDLRLVRFDGTNLYQWRGKQNGSIFEDQASEVFVLTPPAEPVSRPAGEGEREAAEAFAAAPAVQPAELGMAMGHLAALLASSHLTGDYPLGGLGSVSWNDLRAILAALSPQTGSASEGDRE